MTTEEELKDKIVVAMSGGVDSSVAALLLAEEDSSALIGVSMQVWDYRKNGGCKSRATCCSPSDFADARSVAQRIGIPYYVFDFEEHFHEKVISKFIETYASGATPNPCVDCNNDVKFRELRTRADALGCRSVATGHYAKITSDEKGYYLHRAVDRAKDQSYFLYGLKQEELAKTLFPLGDLTKAQVRELAAAAALNTAQKPESQDICFVSGESKDFVSERLTDEQKRSGFLKDLNGAVLGEHAGIHQFTVGQRKGIGVSGSEYPLYVIEIDIESGTVYLGPKESLEVETFPVGELHWMHPDYCNKEGDFTFEAIAQVRHRHHGVPVEVSVSDGVAEVSFSGEWTSPAPGQAAVFYQLDNSTVIGGGRILRQSRVAFPIIQANNIQSQRVA